MDKMLYMKFRRKRIVKVADEPLIISVADAVISLLDIGDLEFANA